MEALGGYLSCLVGCLSTQLRSYYSERFQRINVRQIRIGEEVFGRYMAQDDTENRHLLYISALCYHIPDALFHLAQYRLSKSQRLTPQILKWLKYAADRKQPDACKAMVRFYIDHAPDEVLSSGEMYANICLEHEDIDVIRLMANFYLEKYRSVKLSAPGCERLQHLASRLYIWCSHGYTYQCPQLSCNLAILVWQGIGVQKNTPYAMAILNHVSKSQDADVFDLARIKATLLCASDELKQMEEICIPDTACTSKVAELRLFKTLAFHGRDLDAIQEYLRITQDDAPRALHLYPHKFLSLWPYLCYTKHTLRHARNIGTSLDVSDVRRLSNITEALSVWKNGHSTWPPVATVAYNCLVWNLTWIWKLTASRLDPRCVLTIDAFLDEQLLTYVETVWRYQEGEQASTQPTFRELARNGCYQARFWISLQLYKQNRKKNRYTIPDHLKVACNKGMMTVAAHNLAVFYASLNQPEEANGWVMKLRGMRKSYM